ncbi:hypothetical protein HYY73_04210 [Candidatus Woesearchaeota archaeon]|nr:hypothetical protein [Candidatus Woesearchaeota archaeon]
MMNGNIRKLCALNRGPSVRDGLIILVDLYRALKSPGNGSILILAAAFT